MSIVGGCSPATPDSSCLQAAGRAHNGAAVESKGRQNERNKLIICSQQVLNYWARRKEIHYVIATFPNFVISVEVGYFHYSSRAPKYLTTPL